MMRRVRENLDKNTNARTDAGGENGRSAAGKWGTAV